MIPGCGPVHVGPSPEIRVTKKPRVILHPTPLGDGGFLSRDLFRSYWTPPSSDDDLISIGVVLSEDEIQFRGDKDFLIRIYNDHTSLDIASPAGVLWRVKDLHITRPALIRYFAITEEMLLSSTQSPNLAALEKLKAQGFASAQWIGPPKMDAMKKNPELGRWFLSYQSFSKIDAAKQFCWRQKKQGQKNCKVISRVGIPPLASGTLKAHQSSFSKHFEGIIELISPQGPIEIFDVKNHLMSDELSHGQAYASRLFIIPNAESKFSLVQQTSFSEYLEGVVPAETFPAAHMEALKTQAIIARTYALSHAPIEFSSMPFFTCASTRCQVYRGEGAKTQRTSTAVEQSKNLVLRDREGRFAHTYYHSVCGGHTEDKISSLGGKGFDYLRGLPDGPGHFISLQNERQLQDFVRNPQGAYCETSSYSSKSKYRWTQTLSQNQLRSIAKSQGLDGSLTDIRVLSRGVSGRAEKLLLSHRDQQKTIHGEFKIRSALGGLPSSLFILDSMKKGGTIHSLRIEGGGFGHGVGLCQIGAIGRAEQGQSFRDILQAYYPGLTLDRIIEK